MKVSNATLDSILNKQYFQDLDAGAYQEMMADLASDLKEARQSKRQVVRFPMLVLNGPVDKPTKVESNPKLVALVGAERALVIDALLRDMAGAADAERFPVVLIPELALWILQLTDKRRLCAPKMYPICKAKTKEALIAFVEREKCEPYVDGGLGKVFKKGGPLEWFYAPESDDSYIDVIGNTTQYVAAARQSIPDVGML